MSDQPLETAPHRSIATYLFYALGLAVGVFILVLLFGKRRELTGAFHELNHLNYWWALAAFGVEALSFVGYAYLQRVVLRMGGAQLSLSSLTLVSLANIAIAYTIPGEPAVSSAYRYRFFRRRGASGASAGWAILTILIAQAIGMSLLLLLGVVVALAGNTGAHDTALVIVGLVIVLAAGTLLVRRDLLLRFLHFVVRLAKAVTGHPRDSLEDRIESTLARMRDIPMSTGSTIRVVGIATALWLVDFLCLVCCFGAVHARDPLEWSPPRLRRVADRRVVALHPGGHRRRRRKPRGDPRRLRDAQGPGTRGGAVLPTTDLLAGDPRGVVQHRGHRMARQSGQRSKQI